MTRSNKITTYFVQESIFRPPRHGTVLDLNQNFITKSGRKTTCNYTDGVIFRLVLFVV